MKKKKEEKELEEKEREERKFARSHLKSVGGNSFGRNQALQITGYNFRGHG